MAALSDGGFVAVWHASGDQDGDKKGIFGQRYDAQGVTVGSEFQVNTTTAGNQTFPNVAGLVGGGFAVAWRDENLGVIYARRFDAGGAGLGNDFRVDDTLPGNQGGWRVGVAGSAVGGWMAAWEAAGNGKEIAARFYDATGVGGMALIANDTTANDQMHADTAGLSDGAMTVAWGSGGGQDGSGAGVYAKEVASSGGGGGGTLSSGVYYVHADHLGTPQVITDENQAIVWAADYEPFGTADITVESFTNNLRFPGQYFDAETGLYYNYQRDYHPGLGRYLQPDPIGLPGGSNLYAYALSNPIRYFDPNGKSPAGWGTGIVLALEGFCAFAAKATAEELLNQGVFTNDKQQHCFVSCQINRCLLLLFPYITEAIGGAWESFPGGVRDPADIDANVYGIAKSIESGSCLSHCLTCPIQ